MDERVKRPSDDLEQLCTQIDVSMQGNEMIAAPSTDPVRAHLNGVLLGESCEFPERAKFEAALQKALSCGIVQVQIRGNPRGPKACALLASGHYHVTPGSKVEGISTSIKRSQYEFFVLAHIFTKHAFTGPLFLEGVERGKSARTPLTLTTSDGVVIDAHSPEGQRILAGDPDRFIWNMDHCMSTSHAPLFSDFSDYSNFQGTHAPQTMTKINEALRTFHAFEVAFKRKYRPPRREGEIVHDNISSETRQGTPWIFINRTWYTAQEVEMDCICYLEAMQKIDAFNKEREDEVIEILKSQAASSVPMAWTGSGHAERLCQRCVAEGMYTYLVLPASHQQGLSEKWAGDPAGPHDAGIVRSLRDF